MDARVDWFSFTIPLPAAAGGAGELTRDHILSVSKMAGGSPLYVALEGVQWSLVSGRGFYRYRWFVEGLGMSFSVGEVNAHVLWEFSGQGCEYLRSKGVLYDLIKAFGYRASRIDLAVDMETSASPGDFVTASSAGRFKSRGSYISDSGHTEYIGSRAGERMARVYRYSPPHPRSHLLRAEVEYKGDAARILCDVLDGASLISVTLGAHEPFGWYHPAWQPGMVTAAELVFSRADRESASRLRWLLGVVVPSVVKANREGILSWDAFREAVDDQVMADYKRDVPL